MRLVHALYLLVTVHTTYTLNVPDLSNYNPLQKEGFKHMVTWQHFTANKNDIAASVADFTSTGTDCVRVVVFSGNGVPLDYLHISCDSPQPLLGLWNFNDVVWYYGKVLIKRMNDPEWQEDSKFIIVKVNNDYNSCEKTFWIVTYDRFDNPSRVKGSSVETVAPNGVEGQEGDPFCKDLISLNIPPMMLLSTHGDVGKFHPEDERSTFNAWEPVGAKTRLFRDGMQCFRLLVLYSYGRPVDSMKMACGSMQGVVMSENAFYYGTTVMIKPHDKDMNSFTVFINPLSGKNEKNPFCFKTTFMLIKENGRYIRKRLTTEIEYFLGPECKDLVEGKVQGAAVEKEKVAELLQTLSKDKPDVDSQTLRLLDGYKATGKPSDFNLANELGAVILHFEKTEEDKRKVVLAVARGVVLTGAVVGTDKQTENIVVRADTLYYVHNLFMKKISGNTFTVVVNNNGNGCVKSTYELKDAGGKLSKEDKGSQSLDINDPDCKSLLNESYLQNPEAEKFNNAAS